MYLERRRDAAGRQDESALQDGSAIMREDGSGYGSQNRHRRAPALAQSIMQGTHSHTYTSRTAPLYHSSTAHIADRISTRLTAYLPGLEHTYPGARSIPTQGSEHTTPASNYGRSRETTSIYHLVYQHISIHAGSHYERHAYTEHTTARSTGPFICIHLQHRPSFLRHYHHHPRPDSTQ